MAVLVSIGIIAASLFLCDQIRNNIVTKWNPGLMQNLVLDAILAFELCGPALEFGVIFNHYGIGVWTIGLFCNCLYQIYRWKGLTGPSPYSHILAWIDGKESFLELILRNVTILMAGILTYRIFITNVWNAEFSALHSGRAYGTSSGICVFPWVGITNTQGILAEFIGTFVLTILLGLIYDNPTLSNNDPKYSNVLAATCICLVIHGALSTTGGMFNPMLATVLVSGCKGHDLLDHIIIYWIGSILGAVLGSKLYPTVKSKIYPEKLTKKTQ